VQADLKLAIFEAEFWGPIVGRILNMPHFRLEVASVHT